MTDGANAAANPYGAGAATKGLNTSLAGNGSLNDPNTENIYKKLELLNKELNKPAPPQGPSGVSNYTAPAKQASPVESADVDRLEKMMQAAGASGGDDPEMKQLSGMLEKILDIQHPERVAQRMKKDTDSLQGNVYNVTTAGGGVGVSLLDNNSTGGQNTANGFYSLDDSISVAASQNAIPAAIHETQTLVSGSIVKLRLEKDIHVNGVLIPKDSFIFGVASLSGERLGIEIKGLRYQNSIFPVNLTVYDMDGLDGIHIPGAITRDVAAQSADRSMQNIGLTSLDASWGAQAAGAGIETAKTLFSKKVKLIKVSVKAGYQVLLRDGKQKQATLQLN